MCLYGLFLTTGKGHGTRKAIVAGLLGMLPDDTRIPDALDIADEQMALAVKNRLKIYRIEKEATHECDIRNQAAL